MFVLQTAHGEVISRRQSVERMTELQQSKYQDLQAGLPSELSMQLAEVALALGSAEDQVTPLSLIFLCTLHQMDMLNKLTGFKKHSKWLVSCVSCFFSSASGPGKGEGGAANQRRERGLQLQTPGHRGEAEDHCPQVGRQEYRPGGGQRRDQSNQPDRLTN